MVQGDKRRKVEDLKPLSAKEIRLKIETYRPVPYTIVRDSCLLALIYLSGRRISEVVELKKSDFTIEENRISFITFNAKVFRSKKVGNYKIFRNDKYYEEIYPHFLIDTETGKELSFFILRRLGFLSEKMYLFNNTRCKDDIPITVNMAYRIIRKYIPEIFPHYLRHLRFDYVAKLSRKDPLALHYFTFHKKFESTLNYIRPYGIGEEKV